MGGAVAESWSGDVGLAQQGSPSSAQSSAQSSARMLSVPLRAAEGLSRLDAYLEAELSVRAPAWLAGFYSGLCEEEQEALGVLWAAMIELERGRRVVALRCARLALKLVEMFPSVEGHDDLAGEALRSFAIAIIRRIDGDTVRLGNLYLDAGPNNGLLHAFELLRWRTPIIPFAYAAANRMMVESFDRPHDLTVVDVGSGRGGQLQALLADPWTRERISSLRVIAIEPDPSRIGGRSTLSWSRSGLLEVAERVGVPTTFVGIAKRVEDLRLTELREALRPGRLMVNATLCLHHLGDEEASSERNRALRLFRALGAESLVLVEPDSGHNFDDPSHRLLYAYCHYRSVSRALRHCLSRCDAELVWSKFFQPEIHNVMVHEGSARTERHELGAAWVARLRKHGWSPKRIHVPLQDILPPGFEALHRGPLLSLCLERVPLLSVIKATRSA